MFNEEERDYADLKCYPAFPDNYEEGVRVRSSPGACEFLSAQAQYRARSYPYFLAIIHVATYNTLAS